MQINGEYRIEAPPHAVWEALNDPEVLGRCIPGCETVEKLTPTDWKAKVVAKVGPVKATFGGSVQLSALDPPHRCTITGQGTGGAAGFAKGQAHVTLTADGAATVLRYELEANVGGKLAQIGSRLIEGTTRKMADEFFSCFAGSIVREEAPVQPQSASAPEAAPMMVAPPVPEPLRHRPSGTEGVTAHGKASQTRWRELAMAGLTGAAAMAALLWLVGAIGR